jgi:hypothetical protein
MSNSPPIGNGFLPASAVGFVVVTAALADAAAASDSYHNRGPFPGLERLAQALDPRIDLGCRPKVEDEHMIFAGVDHLLESARISARR